MKILCTHPGRYGDCLWALPTVRAVAETYGAEVDLLVSPRIGDPSFRRLLANQLYLHEVTVAEDWFIEETAPITPRVPPTLPRGYDMHVHLGYDGWPQKSLPYEIERLARQQAQLDPINLERPWLAAPPLLTWGGGICLGFSDEWFELKFGLARLLKERFDHKEEAGPHFVMNVSGGRRWCEDRGFAHPSWEIAAGCIAHAELFVGCCSALHVLACAVGTRVIIVEPNSQRHHDIFYPFSKNSSAQVFLVLGTDGLPTFDARHVVDAVAAVFAPQVAS